MFYNLSSEVVEIINTNNTIEKQVYIAAHELGHVWKIDEKVLAKCDGNIDSEAIINRFAAELLMPAELFVWIFDKSAEVFGLSQGSNKGKRFLYICLMVSLRF